MPRTTKSSRTSTPIDIQAASGRITLSADQLSTIEQRLADGYARIEDARLRGQDVSAWEEFWIDLLHQYEAAVNDLPEAA